MPIMRYTIEHWQTGDIQIKEFPDEMFQITLLDIIEKNSDFSAGFGLNFSELLFYLMLHHQGWQIKRLPLNARDPVVFYKKIIFEREFGMNTEALHGKGAPDFLLYNLQTKKFLFIEVKHTEKTLREDQKKWVEKFGYDLYIVKLARTIGSNYNELTDAEVLKQNKLIKGA